MAPAFPARSTGTVLALCTGTIYGTVPVFTRLAFNAGVPAIETVLIRTYVVAVMLIIAGILLRLSFALPRHLWPAFAGQCLATFAVSASYLVSVQFLPVALAVIVFFTFPVIIGLVAPMVERRRPDMAKIALSLLAFAGLFIAVGPEFSSFNPIGLGLAATAAIGCALQFFTGRLLGQKMAPAAFGGLVHLVILPGIVAVAFAFGGGTLAILPEGTATGTGLLAAVAVAAAYLTAYFLHMTTLKVARPSAVAPFFNIEPIVSTVLAIALLGERLSIPQALGGGLVLAAIVLTSFIGNRTEPA